VELLASLLNADLACSADETYDSSVDALFSYLKEPTGYDPTRCRLRT
jgi:hypothetical protein